jgi:hypothetical protein
MSTISRTADRPTRLEPLRASARLGLAIMAVLHAAAFIVLWLTEYELFHGVLSVLAWALFNCAWLVVLRRPGLSAALSLIMVCSLILLSQFKTGITWVAISFLDFLIIDPDTVAFLLGVFPQLRVRLLLAAIVVIPLSGASIRSGCAGGFPHSPARLAWWRCRACRSPCRRSRGSRSRASITSPISSARA